MCIVFTLIFVFICGVVPFAISNTGVKGETFWICSEFESPFEIKYLKAYKAIVVYQGVDHPLPDRIKGQAGPNRELGPVGIEARCRDGGGTYYRVRGLDLNHELWWGWVKSTSIDS